MHHYLDQTHTQTHTHPNS